MGRQLTKLAKRKITLALPEPASLGYELTGDTGQSNGSRRGTFLHLRSSRIHSPWAGFHSDLHLLRHLSFDRQAHVRRRSKLSCECKGSAGIEPQGSLPCPSFQIRR